MTNIELEDELRKHREVIKYLQHQIQQQRDVARAAQGAANKLSATNNAFRSLGYTPGMGKTGILSRYANRPINPKFYTKIVIEQPRPEGFYLCVGSHSATFRLLALGLEQ